jgi:predicted pyridoxine 5'-phosphate oxidase superfamily flavin-nucleotide-binding protein
MTKSFGSFVFTPAVKALQERYGSRRQYARLEKLGEMAVGFGSDKKEYLRERDSFIWPASVKVDGLMFSIAGAPKGFLKVIDDTTLAFADFRGNKQYISTGNLLTDNRVA